MKSRTLLIILAILIVTAMRAATTGHSLLEEGVRYAKADNFPMALKCFTKSLETAENEDDYSTMVASTGYIGNVYYNLNDYKRSLNYLLKGYDMAKKHNDSELQTSFLTNIVANYCKLHDVQKAHEYFSLLEKQKMTRQTDIYYLIYNRARIAMTEGDTATAIKHHEEALRYAKDNKMDEELSLFQYCELGEIYMKTGNFAKAIEYGHLCEQPAKRQKAFDLLISVYQLLWNANGAIGNDEEKTKYQTLCLSLSDSLFNRSNVFSADNELREYETRQTDEHIASLNGVINRQTLTIIVISLLLILLISLSFLLFRNNRKLQFAHSTLLQKTRELQQQEKKNELLLSRLIDNKPTEPTTTGNTPTATFSMENEQMKSLLAKIMKVMDDIKAITKPDFSLNSLSETVESNTKYVSLIINETYGKNFKTLLNERRIREACRRFSDKDNYGNMTIQAVYEGVGYTNAVSFIRAFKKVNGMTPSEYLKIVSQETNKDEP